MGPQQLRDSASLIRRLHEAWLRSQAGTAEATPTMRAVLRLRQTKAQAAASPPEELAKPGPSLG